MSAIIRIPEVRRRLGNIGKTKFDKDFVKTGRIRLVYLGLRSVGALESNVDRVVDELVAESVANPNRRALSPNDFKKKQA